MMKNEYRTGPVHFGYPGTAPCLNLEDFQFRPGEITVIAGDNGSGKTTLLKLISGLLNWESPEEQLKEELRLSAVYLHQNPYLFRGTVRRNLRLAAPDVSEEERAKALETVGLEAFVDRKVKQLSGGEAKRVAIARAFLSNREIVLLDEPAAHVDAASIRMIEKAIRSLASDGRAVIVTSHRGGFGYRIADRIVDLDGGEISDSALNILKGKSVREEDGHMYFRSGEREIRAPLRDGEYEVAVIPGEDILLSKKALKSSARNCFEGRVVDVANRPEAAVMVRVDCGVVLNVVLTDSAVEEMNIDVGTKVYATFKASSVALY